MYEFDFQIENDNQTDLQYFMIDISKFNISLQNEYKMSDTTKHLL